MSKLTWDQTGERTYETGIDRGVLYIPNALGAYVNGYAWNGLVSVTESPSGAEANPQYADNIKYLNLKSVEEFGATIEAFTYPDEFGQCDGTATPIPGFNIGQQNRKSFGLAYRTKVGNDLEADAGYKLHLVYGADAAPSEKPYATVNDSPEAITFSWEITTTAVEVGEINGVQYKPTASLVLDSTKLPEEGMALVEEALYGTAGTDPRLPTPAEVFAMFGAVNEVDPTKPTLNTATNTLTIPTVAGVVYKIDGVTVTGDIVLTKDVIVTAYPSPGYKFPKVVDSDWLFEYTTP